MKIDNARLKFELDLINQANTILKQSKNFSESLVKLAIRVKKSESAKKSNSNIFDINGNKC